MASGKFGAADLVAATDTEICTVAAGKAATLSVCIANRGSAQVRVRVAISAEAAPAAADYIEYDTPIPANGVLERTGLVLSAGEKIFVRSDLATVSARVHGFDEEA